MDHTFHHPSHKKKLVQLRTRVGDTCAENEPIKKWRVSSELTINAERVEIFLCLRYKNMKFDFLGNLWKIKLCHIYNDNEDSCLMDWTLWAAKIWQMQCVLGAFCIAYFHSKRSHRHFPSNIDLLKFKRTALRYGTRAPTTECPQAIVVMSLQSIVGVVIQVKFNSKHVENSLIDFALQNNYL